MPPETPRTSQHYGIEGFKENITAQRYPGVSGEHHNTMVSRVLRGTPPEIPRTSQHYGMVGFEGDTS